MAYLFVFLLLQKGADKKIKSHNGYTALLIAIDQGHKKIMKLLSRFS